jgi:hypothetical protein
VVVKVTPTDPHEGEEVTVEHGRLLLLRRRGGR